MRISISKLRQIIKEEVSRIVEAGAPHGEEVDEDDVPLDVRGALEEQLYEDGLIDLNANNPAMPEITWIAADMAAPDSEYYRARVIPVLGNWKELYYTYVDGAWHRS